MNIRTTQLSDFFLCPRRHNYEIRETTEVMKRGTFIHKILSSLNRGEKISAELTAEDKEMVSNATTFANANAVVEKSMLLKLTSDFTLEGTPDVIVPSFSLVHDYKTGRLTYKVKSSPQLFLYWYLYNATIEKLVKGILTIEFIRYPVKDKIELSGDKIKQISEAVINSYVKNPDSDEAKVNQFCNYCSLAFDCPLIRGYLNSDHPIKINFAVDVLRSQLSKRVEKILSERPIEIDKVRTLSIQRKVSKKVNVKKAVEELPQKMVIEAILSLDPKKIPDVLAEELMQESIRKEPQVNVDATNL